MTDQMKANLAELLKKHDWWYQMSDDNRWYSAGYEEHEVILSLVKKLGNEGVDMYNAAKPQEDGYYKLEYSEPKE